MQQQPLPEGHFKKISLKAWRDALTAIKIMDERPDLTFPLLFGEVAAADRTRIALSDEGQQLTYGELAARANCYSRWVLDQGLAAGDTVCLMLPNCPDYVAIWLGITQVGCVVALINTNLAGDALLHSIAAAGGEHLIVAGRLLPAVDGLRPQLPSGMRCWVHGDTDATHWLRIDAEVARHSGAQLEIAQNRAPKPRDTALLIYTSGTTGLPKAANVTHRRILEWSLWFAGMMDAQPSDRLYNCLPMYHSIGGIVAVGAMLAKGGAVVIRERFSSSLFWDDIAESQCTIFQYIGELCRYLTQGESKRREIAHRLRLCCGNGLRGDVWKVFQERFQIPQILEFYAATEGNVSLYNCEQKQGAIGRVPAFLAHRFPIALIQCDVETGEVRRDQNGFCIRCGPDEPGEAVGKILVAPDSLARQFDGYTDPEASARKVMRNVFEPGDCWFRTGDLMRKDSAGFYYFLDRLGDTFRWKGENVSTAEVAAVVNACPGVTGAVVFGVTVPGYEGRAGMAAVTTNGAFSPTTLQAHLAANLAPYARPLFIRLCGSLEVTGTFKLKTARLQQEGFAAAPDTILFFDRNANEFIKCDQRQIRAILDGTVQRL
jgi:fatty-acyl-CoA synthase